MGDGVIRIVKDLIIQVMFDEDMPSLNEVLVVNNRNHSLLLVDSLKPGGIATCLNVRSDRTVQKSMSVKRNGQYRDSGWR